MEDILLPLAAVLVYLWKAKLLLWLALFVVCFLVYLVIGTERADAFFTRIGLRKKE